MKFKHLTINCQLSIVNCQLFSYSVILSFILFFSSPLKAQVTIGSQDPPHSFSVLELKAKEKDEGLRLPQLTTLEREALNSQLTGNDEAKGLVVFDTDLDCLEFWNGTEWVSMCSDALAPVSGTGTIDACVTAMYDFQYQTLTAYGVTNAAQWQWYAKRRGEADSEYKPIPNATAVSYKIPANFVKDVFRKTLLYSGTDNNDSVVFQVKVSNALKIVISSDTLDIEYIDTYGKDYAELNANYDKAGNLVPNYSLKIAYLNLGVEPDADGYNACDFGSLYQWGRWRDGHEKITWTKATVGGNIDFDDATKLNAAPVNDLTPDDYDSNPPALEGDAPFYQVKSGYAGKFLFSDTNPIWNTNATQSDYQGFWATSNYDKTSNDPCPTGWHVPTQFEFGAIFQGTPSSDNPSTATNLNNTWTRRPNTSSRIAGGYIVTYGDGSDKSKRIFMPAAGLRSYSYEGTLLGNAGSFGYYWSSMDIGTSNALLLYLAGNVFAGNIGLYKAYGFSVRCVSE